MTPRRSPRLHGGAPRGAKAVTSAVLILHGGQDHSVEPTTGTQLSLLRMLDMYAGLRRRSRASAIYLLRYRVRGWNADPTGRVEPDPVTDARWALDEISARHPDVSIALLGHSMGGRTAFAVAGDDRVGGVCGLAPWLPEGEPVVAARADQRFVIAHGTADRMTSAPASLAYAGRLRSAGARVVRLELSGGRHALLDKPFLWHRLAVSVSLALVGEGAFPPAVHSALQDGDPGSLRLNLNVVADR